MQFYIIDDDPIKNASLLPNYCLKRVNIREGWQILSDIGHLFNVTWEGQNKEYNPYHAETRQYWTSLQKFDYFIAHYSMCLLEYEKRYNKRTVWHDRTVNFMEFSLPKLRMKIDNEKGNQIVKYLLDRKLKFLTINEVQQLSKI